MEVECWGSFWEVASGGSGIVVVGELVVSG